MTLNGTIEGVLCEIGTRLKEEPDNEKTNTYVINKLDELRYLLELQVRRGLDD